MALHLVIGASTTLREETPGRAEGISENRDQTRPKFGSADRSGGGSPVGEAEAAHLVGREERRPLIRRRPIHLVMWRAGSGQHWGEARKGGEREGNCRRELSGTVGFESESHTGNEQRREGLVARTSRHG
jgi:hypothetical protein